MEIRGQVSYFRVIGDTHAFGLTLDSVMLQLRRKKTKGNQSVGNQNTVRILARTNVIGDTHELCCYVR